MANKYKLILSNQWMYREITLSDERTNIQIGTRRGSTIRFRKEYFHDDFVVMLDYENGRWYMSCVNTSYITEDGVTKAARIELSHGIEFYVNFSRILIIFLNLEYLKISTFKEIKKSLKNF